jgi:transposase
MGKQRSLSPVTRTTIVTLRNEHYTFGQIANIVSRSETACRQAYKLFEETGGYSDRQRVGRPRKTSEKLDRIIHRLSEGDRTKTAVDIRREIAGHQGGQVSVWTIRRRLRQFGLHGRIARKKPFISHRNRQRRLKFAREHLNWTPKDWARVLWSDESKFQRFGSDGKTYVRRRPGEEFNSRCLRPTVKGGGGSVMVWGGFSRNGPGPIHQINGIMDRFVYLGILTDILEPYADDYLPLNWIFQQDNDPKHTSRIVKDWLQEKRIEVLNWPAQSPDLNPIENLWHFIDKDIKLQKPSNLNELYAVIESSWRKISIELCVKLVDSMPKRCQAVIKNFGYATKY